MGIDRFIVPKSTITLSVQATIPRKAGIPIQGKDVRVGTPLPSAGKERVPRRSTNTSNSGVRAVQSNDHITRKKSGKAYNPALEVDPGPPPISTEDVANLPGHTLTACEQKLCLVYGDHIHRNNGTHLTGGIADNALWQTICHRISNLIPMLYDAPNVKAGRRFVTLLTEELRGSRERCWNSKIPMVFKGTVLAKIPGVKNSKDIRARLLRRMDHWTDGHIGSLIKDTCGTGNARGVCAGAISKRDKEKIDAVAYDRKVKAGHILASVRQATDWVRGVVVHVNSTDPKSGMLALGVLRLKHPDLQEVDLGHPD